MTKKNILSIMIFLVVVILGVVVFLKNNKSLHKEMIIGVNMPYGLMEFINDKGEADGFDIDVIKEVAKRIGLKPIIVNYEWDELFQVLKNKEIDVVISSVTITKEREKEMLFSDPYTNVGQVVIVKKDNEEIYDKENLKHKKIGSQKDTTGLDLAKQLTDESLVFIYDDYSKIASKSIIKDLEQDKIDAIVVDYGAALGIIRENPNFKITGEPLTEEFSGIVVDLGNDLLKEKINEALRDMKRDGSLQKIENKWLESGK